MLFDNCKDHKEKGELQEGAVKEKGLAFAASILTNNSCNLN